MNFEMIQGDCLDVLPTLPAKSVHTCVTSPPYFGLRNYGVEGQIGLEPTPDEFVAAMVAVFREVRRVLRDDGTCWVNLGDSYAGSGKGPTGVNGVGQHERRQGFHSPKQLPQTGKMRLRQDLSPEEQAYVFAELAKAWRIEADTQEGCE